MSPLAWILAAFFAAAEPAPPAQAPAEEPHKIYECTDPSGSTVYQDDPCPIAPPPQTPPKVKATPPSPSKAGKSKPKPPPPPQPQVRQLRFVVPKMGPPEMPSREVPGRIRAADERWRTPDTALKTFVAAVASGDRAAIVSCLTDSALADWGPEPESLELDRLRKTVGAFTGYVAEGDVGPYWSIRALREGMRPKWIFFERTGDGEWKIAAL